MKLSKSRRALLEAATSKYQAHVGQARAYLASRGFTDEAVATSRLGFVAEPDPDHVQMASRLSIPYITPAGVVSMKFRCLAQHDCKAVNCPKYLGIHDDSRLFNTRAFFKRSPVMAITEGELDALTLDLLVGIPAVGVPGATSWKKHYGRCFNDYEKVYLFVDGDEAGRKFATSLLKEIDAITVYMPEGMDVNSAYVDLGREFVLGQAGLLEAK